MLLDTHIFLWWLFDDARLSEGAKDTPAWIIEAGFEPLPILPIHAQLAGSWDIPHRDPFDRMLAAQGRIENLPLASDDPVMELFGIEIVR